MKCKHSFLTRKIRLCWVITTIFLLMTSFLCFSHTSKAEDTGSVTYEHNLLTITGPKVSRDTILAAIEDIPDEDYFNVLVAGDVLITDCLSGRNPSNDPDGSFLADRDHITSFQALGKISFCAADDDFDGEYNKGINLKNLFYNLGDTTHPIKQLDARSLDGWNIGNWINLFINDQCGINSLNWCDITGDVELPDTWDSLSVRGDGRFEFAFKSYPTQNISYHQIIMSPASFGCETAGILKVCENLDARYLTGPFEHAKLFVNGVEDTTWDAGKDSMFGLVCSEAMSNPADTTVYNFVVPDADVSVGFYTAGGYWQYEDGTYEYMQQQTQKALQGIKPTLPAAPTRPGYEFVGWSSSPGATDAEVTQTTIPEFGVCNCSYYAVWKEQPKATFVLEDGATWQDGTKEEKTTSGDTDSLIPAPDDGKAPVRQGYIFDGWEVHNNPDERYVAGYTRFTEDEITYVAVWIAQTEEISVVFDAGSGSWAASHTISISGPASAFIVAPVSPEYEGHVLVGWLSDDTKSWLEPTTTFAQAKGHSYTAQYVESLGWHQDDMGWYYIYDLKNSRYMSCWASIYDCWFYFDEKGYRLEDTWAEIKDKWYYFGLGGFMQTGWIQLDNRWYFLNRTTGAMQTGWLQDGAWYYLDAKQSGAMYENQWGYINGEWYFFGWGGYMQTGWQWLGGSWYFLDRYTGAMKCGWVHDGVWYYCDAEAGGAMYDNCWAYIDGEWYGFNEGGSMTQGWSYSYAYDGWFYLQPDTGHMLYGWQYIGGHWYYFYDNGVMAANTRIGVYRVGTDGVMQ